MKYSLDASLQEIQKRRDARLRRRSQRRVGALSGSTALLAVLLLAAARQFAGAGAAWASDSVYGAFLLSPAAGGYVLAGVIAFAAGIAVTVLCIARRGAQRQRATGRSGPGSERRNRVRKSKNI